VVAGKSTTNAEEHSTNMGRRPSRSGDAAHNDLSLCKTLWKYRTIHLTIAVAAIDKIGQHLWYLSGELVGLSLFSSRVSIEEKRLIQGAIAEAGECWDGRVIRPRHVEGIEKKSLNEFVNTTT
jgi:hypothetical protein